MKIFISILLFSLSLSFAQSSYIAVISNPEVVAEQCNDSSGGCWGINKQQNISHVVVIGNITANGKFDEFVWHRKYLMDLLPLLCSRGEKDYLLSEVKALKLFCFGRW